MTFNDFQQFAKENNIVYCTEEVWETIQSDMCDRLCVAPSFFGEDQIEDICKKCPLNRMEGKR